jgi:16S rRNA (guanine966-N2)-methyltransferase
MSLHIIGGTFRNRSLKAPKTLNTRPTSAILRKSVFDSCQFEIQDAHVLDLYAGSGAIGLEALSRGAASATFVEHDKHALKAIHENIASLGVQDKAQVIGADVLLALKRFKKPFNFIYIDPPYAITDPLPIILDKIQSEELLAPPGLLFVEEAFPSHLHPEQLMLSSLIYKETRKFGDSLLHKFTTT